MLAKTFCNRHYARARRWGDPHFHPPRNEVAEYVKALYRSPEAHSGEWPYSRTPFGYGRVFWDGRMMYAHQLACLLAHGPRPNDRAVVRHSCRNHTCFWADHLKWGTQAENNGDMRRDGTSPKGERNSQARLTEVGVAMIRCLLEGGFSQYDIADIFGVTQSNVSVIKNGRSWV